MRSKTNPFGKLFMKDEDGAIMEFTFVTLKAARNAARLVPNPAYAVRYFPTNEIEKIELVTYRDKIGIAFGIE